MSDRLHAASVVVLRVSSIAGLGIALAGCAAGGGWAAALMVVLSLGALTLSGCTTSHTPGDDAGPTSDGAADDALPPHDAGGNWERCCVSGRIDSCFCPSGWACNYGWFEDCGDGTCSDPGGTCSVDLDAGVDAGGTWEPCCIEGRIESCFCPGGAECNYGWYEDCGGGACAEPGTGCAADGGMAGSWEPCCVDGAITTCFCPSGVACNYGWYLDCGDGVCVDPISECPG